MLELAAHLSHQAHNTHQGEKYDLHFLQQATSYQRINTKAVHDYCCIFLTQMTVEEGIKIFGDKVIATLLKDVTQLYDLNVFTVVMVSIFVR